MSEKGIYRYLELGNRERVTSRSSSVNQFWTTTISNRTASSTVSQEPLSCLHRLVSGGTAAYEVPRNFDPVNAAVSPRPKTGPSHQVGEADLVDTA